MSIANFINVFKWIFAAIFVFFIVAVCLIFSTAFTHKPKEYLNLTYEKYESTDLNEKPHVLPDSAENINLHLTRDYRPGRGIFYVFHEAELDNIQSGLDFIMAKCLKSAPKDKTVKLYQKDDTFFLMEKFVSVFDERFIPEWWNDDTMKNYNKNRLTAWDKSGFWIFYNLESNYVRVFQWHDSKEDLALIDRELFEGELMDNFVNAVKDGDTVNAKNLIVINPVTVFIDKYGKTPLHYAVELSDISFAKFLIANGIDKNANDNKQITPLYLAVYLGDKQMVEFLIKKQVNVNCVTNDGFTPLYMAILNENKYIESLLVGAGADLKSEVGFTALHAAVINGKIQMAEYWLAKGAKINASINPTGYTPLHTAVIEQNKEMIKFLINKGADVTFKNRFGQTPLELANNKGYNDIAEMIRRITKHF